MTKRAILSCDLCRARKVRCDKGDPCSGCTLRGMPCERMDAEAQEIILQQQAETRRISCSEQDNAQLLRASSPFSEEKASDDEETAVLDEEEVVVVVAAAPTSSASRQLDAHVASLQTVNRALGAALGLTPAQLALLVSTEETRLLNARRTAPIRTTSMTSEESEPSPTLSASSHRLELYGREAWDPMLAQPTLASIIAADSLTLPEAELRVMSQSSSYLN